jgi:hypothetical protein
VEFRNADRTHFLSRDARDLLPASAGWMQVEAQPPVILSLACRSTQVNAFAMKSITVSCQFKHRGRRLDAARSRRWP